MKSNQNKNIFLSVFDSVYDEQKNIIYLFINDYFKPNYF